MNVIQSKPKLIACDYDGTLAPSPGQISERSKKALWLAHEEGCLLALITGRSVGLMPLGLDELPFDFIISGNGARIEDRKNGHYLSITSMKKEIAIQVVNALKKRSIKTISISVDEKSYFHFRTLKIHSFFKLPKSQQNLSARINYLKQFHYSFNLGRFVNNTKEPIEKINVYFTSQEECQAAYADILPLNVSVYTTHGTDLEITAMGVTKGSALAALCKYLSISPTDSLAFGDSGNDSSMIGVAGCFLAPKNAMPDIQANADIVIPSVEEDGVALVLEELFGHAKLETTISSEVDTPIHESVKHQ